MNSPNGSVRVSQRSVPGRSKILPLGGVLALTLLSVMAFSVSGGSPSAHPSAGAPVSRDAAAAAAHVAPAAGTFNPPCYPVNSTVCVSIWSANESDIVPPIGTFYSAVEPNVSQTITLIVKAQEQLDWVGNQHMGPNSPIALNVTAVTWNGDPYYSPYDGNVWHADTNTWWAGPSEVPTNKSGYTWWYWLNISAKSSGGSPNFLPGMTVTWWIALTHNSSNVLTHTEGPKFRFTYSQAWPYSPYPGSGQYVAGGGATFEDVNLTVQPLSPNWNDTVSLVLNTTQADVLANATIGAAYVDLTETSPTGALIQTGTVNFPVDVTASGFGATSTTAVIPAGYSQVASAVVTYHLTIMDVPGDTLVTPTYTYTVGSNGTFISGIFLDDLNIATTPGIVIQQSPDGVVAPGTQVNFTLTSRNAGTAISAAAINYTVEFPLLKENVTLSSPFHRVSSTEFRAALPGLALGAIVRLSVDAWDFNQRLEISPQLTYSTPTLDAYLPNGIPGNSGFFYVLVYDNGTHTWVSNATLQVIGPQGFYNSKGNVTFGLAYPNSTTGIYLPLLIPANASYQIILTDSAFAPHGTSNGPVTVNISVTHAMGIRQTLVQAPNYEILEEQNVILFYLNSTPPAPAVSPTATSQFGNSVLDGFTTFALVGVAAFSVGAIVTWRWWAQIRARRKAEERRVTL